MNFEKFKSIIESIEESKELSSTLQDLKIDLLDYNEQFTKVIDALLEEVFGECGKDWIDWYLYERVTYSGEILKAWDKNKNEICYDVPSLWETVKEYITAK